jgi:3-hydroxyisobutyrate dehydrogenase
MASLCRKRQLSAMPSLLNEPILGFIGLGNMGLPMALNLQSNSGTTVFVYDVNNEACDVAKSKGLHVTKSILEMVELMLHDPEIGSNSENLLATALFITMVPNCAVVDSVMNELIVLVHDDDVTTKRNSSPKIVLIDCSTVHPSTSRKWNRVWDDRGHYFFDAPVSGGTAGAQEATLSFMAGASKQDIGLQLARPYLEMMGSRIIECGGPGAGSVAKLCNNLALATQMVGICEALTLGDALGVDPVVLSDVMNISTAKCWSNDVNNPHPTVARVKGKNSPASRQYQGGFGTKLILKDLTLALNAADDCGALLPVTKLTNDLYKSLNDKGLGDKDFGVMFQYLQDQIKDQSKS